MKDRLQRVRVGSTNSSNILRIIIGVLQGSILGVILFIIFINDIGMAAPNLLKIFFADDITGMLSAKKINELITKANFEINNLVDWYTCNKLSILTKVKQSSISPPTLMILILPQLMTKYIYQYSLT